MGAGGTILWPVGECGVILWPVGCVEMVIYITGPWELLPLVVTGNFKRGNTTTGMLGGGGKCSVTNTPRKMPYHWQILLSMRYPEPADKEKPQQAICITHWGI
jgi:hypothetical protein